MSHDMSIQDNWDYENFGFTLNYHDYPITMILSGTGKGIQFEYGEGGKLDVLPEDSDYPDNSMEDETFLEFLIDDPSVREKVEYTFGKNEKDVEYTMQVLKDYLDKRYEEEHK